MSSEFAKPKSIHSLGLLSISRDGSSNSEKIISCSIDGTVAIWDRASLTDEGTFPEKREIADRTHSSCALFDGDLYVGFTQQDLGTGVEKQVVGMYKANSENQDSVKEVLKFALDITVVRASQKWILAGSSDFSVKKADRYDLNSGYTRIEMNSQILDIQIASSEKFFAVSSCDGLVSMFNDTDSDPISTHKLFTPIRDIDESFPRVIMSFSSDGRTLFVPSNGSVRTLKEKEGKWEMGSEYRDSTDKVLDYSTCTVSPCGNYLAASTMTSTIIVWDIARNRVVGSHDYGAKRGGRVSSIAYLGTESNELVIADSHGALVLVKNLMEEQKEEKVDKTKSKSKFVVDEADDDDAGVDSFDEDGEEEDEIVVNKSKRFIVEDEEEDENTRLSSTSSLGAIKKKYGFDNDGEREEGVNGAEGDSFDEDPFANLDKRPDSTSRWESASFKPSALAAPAPIIERYTPPSMPKYFASASSPRNLAQRYIKWNGFGTIRVFENDGDSSLEIRFHDSTVHAEILIANTETEYCMGDLNDRVVALASAGKKSSKLYARVLNSWESNGDEWTVEMGKADHPQDVVVSREFIALLCENRSVRIFTHTGTQRHIIAHPSHVLTMSAFGDRLAIVSVSGGPLFYDNKDEQVAEFPLSVHEYRIGACSQWWSSTAQSSQQNALVTATPLALPPLTTLTWLAYTNQGRIVAQASDSSIRVLIRSPSPSTSSSFWTPIFDGSDLLTSPSDSIWPISLVEKPRAQLRYVYCRGVKYPMVNLNLTPVVANWSIPLFNKESDKSQLEEDLLLNEYALAAASAPDEIKDLSTAHLKVIIKLFSLACRAEREGRAVEVATMTTSAKGVQLLANYAAKLKKTMLVEKVSEVGRRKAEEEEERQAESERASSSSYMMRSASGDRDSNDEDIRVLPKKVALRRSVNTPMRAIPEFERESSQSSTPGDYEDEPSSTTAIFSLETSTGRNPFKRSLDDSLAAHDTSSTSVFDDFDSPSVPARKKLKETQNTAPVVASKQAKLSFGAATKTSGYDLWLADNTARLKEEFVGGEDEFAKYCTQAFRILPAATRKEWRLKAESS